jgi:O-antigen/teichoic acid export membrane protein
MSQGLNFATIFLIAKNIGPRYFGIFNLVQITIGTLVTFSTFGLVLSTTKLVAENIKVNIEKTNNILSTIFSITIILSFLMIFILSFFSNHISFYFFSRLDLGIYFKICAMIILFDSIYSINSGILFALEAFKETAFINIISGAITTIILIISSYKFDINVLFISLLISKFFNLFVSSLYLKKILHFNNLKINLKISLNNLKSILKISFPSFLSSLTNNPITWISTSLLAKQNDGIYNLGMYNFYNQFRTIVLFLPDSAGKVTFPKLTNLFSSKMYHNFNKLVISTILINLLLSFFPALTIYLFSKYFFEFFKIDFQYNNILLFLILLNSIFISINNAFGYVFVSLNYVWIDFLFRIITGGIFLFFVYQFGRYNGPVGYAKSLLFSNIFYLISQIIFTIYFLKNLNYE